MTKAKSKTTAARGAKTVTKPGELVRALQAAALPFIDAKGEDLRKGASFSNIYMATAPLLPGYTVADVVPLTDILRNAVNRSHERGVEAARRSNALSRSLWLLEDFVSYARASGPECAAARAAILADSLTDDGVLCDTSQPIAAQRLQDDIARLTAGRFEGERFDDFANDVPSQWLYSVLFDREKLSAPTVNAMRGKPVRAGVGNIAAFAQSEGGAV